MSSVQVEKLWQNLWDLWLPVIGGLLAALAVLLLIHCLHKRRWVGAILVAVLVAASCVGVAIYRAPHALVDWKPEEVSRIMVSGTEVSDPETIAELLADLGGTQYRRTLPSGIGGQEEYSIRIYGRDGTLLCSLGIAGETMVDSGGFWEQRETGWFDLSLYQTLTARP